jgi:hypothetical protein
MHRRLRERLASFLLLVVVSRAWRAHPAGRGR